MNIGCFGGLISSNKYYWIKRG